MDSQFRWLPINTKDENRCRKCANLAIPRPCPFLVLFQKSGARSRHGTIVREIKTMFCKEVTNLKASRTEAHWAAWNRSTDELVWALSSRAISYVIIPSTPASGETPIRLINYSIWATNSHGPRVVRSRFMRLGKTKSFCLCKLFSWGNLWHPVLTRMQRDTIKLWTPAYSYFLLKEKFTGLLTRWCTNLRAVHYTLRRQRRSLAFPRRNVLSRRLIVGQSIHHGNS